MMCAAKGCLSPAVKRGMCNKHYLRWWKFGDADGGSTPKGAPHVFLTNTVLPYEGEECLTWPYATVSGYGQIRIGNKAVLVTRVVCENAYGPPPIDGLEAAHSCGNGHLGCVTKRHLRWATRKENRQDMVNHGRSNRGKKVRFNRLTDEQRSIVMSLVGTVPDHALALKVGVSPSSIRYYRKENV